MKQKIINALLFVSNIILVAFGWIIFILFDLTSYDDPKFDINQIFRIIIFPTILISCVIGEILILKTIYRKIYNSNLKGFIVYLFFNGFICVFPLLIGLIESFFN